MLKLVFQEVSDYFEFIKYLEKSVLEDAEKRETADTLHHNNGGTRQRELLKIYMNALNKEIPVEWSTYFESFIDEKKKERDPEYAEFIRLREKFEGENNGV